MVTLDAASEVEVAEQEVRVALFQCIRELLFNIVKHAQVQNARIQVNHTDRGAVQIMVSDHGVGFDPAKVLKNEGLDGGFGLFSQRERLELIGGHLDIQSAPGCGSRFTILGPSAQQCRGS